MTPEQPQNPGSFRLPFGLTVERATIWLFLLLIAYSLRSFFTTVFMTFILSYVVHNLVTVLIGAKKHPEREDLKVRKWVIVLVYLVALLVGYGIAQSIVPLAVEQGRWLTTQLPQINPDKVRDDLLARTIGRFEFSRFKRSPEYDKAFKEFVSTRYNSLNFQEAVQLRKQVYQTFEEDLVQQLGQDAVRNLKTSNAFDDHYKQWLLANRAEKELDSSPDLRRRLTEDYDASYKLINGEAEAAKARTLPSYIEKRAATNLTRVTSQLFSAGTYREAAEADLAQRLGKEAAHSLSPSERKERFRTFFNSQIPKRFVNFPFTIEKFEQLEGVKNEAEFQKVVGPNGGEGMTADEKFQAWKEMELAKASPIRDALGDGSQFVRTQLPQLTDWLASTLNSMISFGLTALLSLTFSAMIVWEIPQIRRALVSIKGTRAEIIYDEIAPGLQRLGSVVGLAFTAQFVIATIDASLAYACLALLKVPSALFLSLIVLVFSLIPYFGVLLAAPVIFLVCLQSGGARLAFQSLMVFFVIHEVEAWFLSPWILGEFLQLSPLLVVFVLFTAQPLFGIWGLLLGAPVAEFLIKYVFLQPVREQPRSN
jgi:predicted PurR-regulated permease PerM